MAQLGVCGLCRALALQRNMLFPFHEHDLGKRGHHRSCARGEVEPRRKLCAQWRCRMLWVDDVLRLAWLLCSIEAVEMHVDGDGCMHSLYVMSM